MSRSVTPAEGAPVSSHPARIEYYDVAKAVAMVAIIAGHTALRFPGQSLASAVVAVTFSFHLPLFFIVSGRFLRADGTLSLRRELRALVLPYAVTAALVVAGLCASNLVLHDLGSTRELFANWANAAVYGAGDVPSDPLWPQTARIGAIWFLLALFWARIELSLVARLPEEHRLPLILAGFMVGVLSADRVFLPLSVQPGLCAAPFLWLGGRLGPGRESGARRPRPLPAPSLLLIALIWAYAISRYQGFAMAMCAFGSTVPDFLRNVVGGICGTACVVTLCRLAERRFGRTAPWRVLSWAGRMTLLVLCVHLFEDDVLRWGAIAEGFTALVPWRGGWLLVLLARVLVDFLVAWALDGALRRARGAARPSLGPAPAGGGR